MINHTHNLLMGKGRQSLRTYGVTIEKVLYKQRPERRQEILLDKDKLLITLYNYSSRLSRWLVCLFPSSKTRKKVCAYFNICT